MSGSNLSLSQLEIRQARADSAGLALEVDETTEKLQRAAEAFVRQTSRNSSTDDEYLNPAGVAVPIATGRRTTLPPAGDGASDNNSDVENQQPPPSSIHSLSQPSGRDSSSRETLKRTSSARIIGHAPKESMASLSDLLASLGNQQPERPLSATQKKVVPASVGDKASAAEGTPLVAVPAVPDTGAKSPTSFLFVPSSDRPVENSSLKIKREPSRLASISDFLEKVSLRVMSNEVHSLRNASAGSPYKSQTHITSSSITSSSQGLDAEHEPENANDMEAGEQHDSENVQFSNATPLVGKSLLLFSADSRLRSWLYFALHSKIFSVAMTIIIIINWILLASASWERDEAATSKFGEKWQAYALLPVFVIYSLEILARLITFGGYRDNRQQLGHSLRKVAVPPPFFRNSLNVFDFCVTASFWVDMMLSLGGSNILLFRAISALRPARLVTMTSGLAVFARSITASGVLLRRVLFFLLFFYTVLGIMGVQFFRGSLNRQCMVETTLANGTLFEEPAYPRRTCGAYQTAEGVAVPPLHGDPVIKGYVCPVGQICKVVDIADLRPQGIISFDWIAPSMFSLFQSASEQGWTTTMYNCVDSEFEVGVIFHVLAMIIIDFVLMNMLVAVIAETFANIQAEYREKLSKERRSQRHLKQTKDGWAFSDDQNTVQHHKWTSRSRRIMQHPRFRSLLFLASAGSLATIAFEFQFRDDPDVLAFLWAVDIGLVIFFAAEFSLQALAATNLKRHFHKISTIVDGAIMIITFGIVFPTVYRTHVYRYLTVFQILRFYKTAEMFPRIPRIIKTAFGNVVDLLNALVFFIMVIGILATAGMQLLGGKFWFLDRSTSAANFDSFPEAFLSIFIIMVSDNWTDILYNGLLSQGQSWIGFLTACAFFIPVYVLTHSILIDIAVAVILENFELDEDEKRYGQIVQLINRLERKNSTANYLSAWNPYRYLKSSPDLLQVRFVPERLRSNMRELYFNLFMTNRNKAHEQQLIKESTIKSAKTRTTMGLVARCKAMLDAIVHGRHINTDLGSAPALNVSVPFSTDGTPGSSESLTITTEAGKLNRNQLLSAMAQDAGGIGDNKQENRTRNPNAPLVLGAGHLDSSDTYFQGTSKPENHLSAFKEDHPTYDKSYFIFRNNNPIRIFCKNLSNTHGQGSNAIFSRILIVAIVASTVILAFDTPLSRLNNLEHALSQYAENVGLQRSELNLADPEPGLIEVLQRSEYLSSGFYVGESIFVVIFTAEFFIRTIADGVLFTPNPYLLNGWHILDIVVLVSMWLGITTQFVGVSGVPRAIRAARALRPLRLIALSSGLKNVFSLIVSSMTQILDALALVLFFIVPYSVWGLSIFHDLFYRCNDNEMASKDTCVGHFLHPGNGILMPRVWTTRIFGFDTLWTSIFSLFEMMMEEGWSDKLYAGISIVGVDRQPVWPNPKLPWWNAFYFLGWMLFGFVLLRYLFVGVILQTFMTRKGTALLTVEQRRWVDLEKKMKLIKPTNRAEPPPSSSVFRSWCYRLVKDKNGRFFQFTSAMVLLNLLIMATEYQQYIRYPDGDLGYTSSAFAFEEDAREMAYFFFTCVYLFELVANINGLGWKKWKRNSWNIFDFCLLCGLCPIVVLRIFNIDQILQQEYVIFQAQKLFLDMVVLKLVKRVQMLHMLFRTVAASFRSILSILGVLGLVFTVYGLVAVEAFGLTKLGMITDAHANFRDFGRAVLTLFRMTTGEKWNDLFRDMMLEYPECVVSEQNYLLSDCGSVNWSIAILLSFEVLVTLMMINLFVVTVIDNFDYASQDNDSILLSMDDMSRFKKIWVEVDPNGTGFIQASQLASLLRKLDGRMDMKIYETEYSISSLLHKVVRAGNLVDVDKVKGRSTSELDVKHFPDDTNGHYRVDALCNTLASMNVEQTRRRRHTYNFVYQEALLHEEPGRGIPFSRILRILAYKVIDVEQYLKIDQMFIRQQEMTNIQENVYRDKIKSLFSSYALRRRYLQNKTRTRGTPTAADVSKFRSDIPYINVTDNADEIAAANTIPIIILDGETAESVDELSSSGPQEDSSHRIPSP